MNPLGPIVVPRSVTRDVSVRGGTTRETLAVDMTTQGLADIQHFAQSIFLADVEQQSALANPPDQIIVDGNPTKPIDRFEHRAVAIFGSTITPLLMRALERELVAAIAKATTARTGKLANLANWQWFLNRQPIAGAGAVRQFGQVDTLTFAPTRVTKSGGAYATVANQRAATRGKLVVSKKSRKTKEVTHTATGFVGFTARKLRAMTAFRQFAISVQWDRAGAFGPNLGNQGMAFFMIRLRRAKRAFKG